MLPDVTVYSSSESVESLLYSKYHFVFDGRNLVHHDLTCCLYQFAVCVHNRSGWQEIAWHKSKRSKPIFKFSQLCVHTQYFVCSSDFFLRIAHHDLRSTWGKSETCLLCSALQDLKFLSASMVGMEKLLVFQHQWWRNIQKRVYTTTHQNGKTKVVSPGFEPGIFRVWGERIDQLSHETLVTCTYG